MTLQRLLPSLSVAAALLLGAPAGAQFAGLTLPPDGDNQQSSVSQNLGLVRVTVDYHSPDVHAPNGDDRAGKIWGQLVPYGMANLGFGTCGDQCPWRGGANENTVFTVSHDVKVQGQPLPAGAYGLHFIPGQDEWTVVFSKNHTSWGSFTYDAKEDALRVKAKPEPGEYHEWLTYEFTDRHPDKATVALKWEKLQVPFTITVENSDDLYVQNIREQLRSWPGFNWQNWNAAAQFSLQHKTHLDEGLRWAQQAASTTLGQRNFTTLSTLAELQAANGQAAEAQKTRETALNDPTAGPIEMHLYARGLLAQKKVDEAVQVFELNAKRHPGAWPVELGLARGLAAQGKKKEALAHAKNAIAQAPDEANRKNVEGLVKLLEEGKDL